MKKTHTAAIVIVLLLIASLAFAQQNAVTYGAIAAEQTPSGVLVEGEEVTLTQPAATHPKPAAVHHKSAAKMTAAQQRAAGARDTQADNASSLKKGEPSLKVNKTTTTTDVYDLKIKNKKGTTDYEVVEQTHTNAQGHKTSNGVIYSSYEPSKMARANAQAMEVSLAAGTTLLYNKDNDRKRYGDYGLAADITLLKRMGDHLALGMDYALLHPGSRTHGSDGDKRHYHGIYAHNISLAGKLTLNPWDAMQVYLPMGVGMTNARMETRTDGENVRDNKWGASFYAGIGVQYDITCRLFAGMEYRYAYAFVSDKDLTPYAKDRNLQFHTLMLRMGMRF